MVIINEFDGIAYTDFTNGFTICGHHLFFGCENQKMRGIHHVSKLGRRIILLDDSAGTLETSSLFHHRDSATSCSDYNLPGIQKGGDRINLINIHRVWRGDDTPETVTLRDNKVTFFFFCVSLLPSHHTANYLGWMVECFVKGIHTNLCDHGRDRLEYTTIQ